MRFKRPTAAWLVAVTALVLALGTGTAIGRHLLTGRDIRNGSLTGADIKHHSITLSNISTSATRAMRGEAGPAGAPGPAGPAGPAGPPGPSQLGAITRVEQDGSVAAGDVNHVTATCPSGQGVISGGYITAGSGVTFGEDSFGASDSWAVLYDNSSGTSPATVNAVAYCAPKGQAASPRSTSGVAAAIAHAEAVERAAH